MDEKKVNHLVLPGVHREVAFQGILRDTGHPGKHRWISRQRFFYPGLEREIFQKVVLIVSAPGALIEANYFM